MVTPQAWIISVNQSKQEKKHSHTAGSVKQLINSEQVACLPTNKTFGRKPDYI